MAKPLICSRPGRGVTTCTRPARARPQGPRATSLTTLLVFTRSAPALTRSGPGGVFPLSHDRASGIRGSHVVGLMEAQECAFVKAGWKLLVLTRRRWKPTQHKEPAARIQPAVSPCRKSGGPSTGTGHHMPPPDTCLALLTPVAKTRGPRSDTAPFLQPNNPGQAGPRLGGSGGFYAGVAKGGRDGQHSPLVGRGLGSPLLWLSLPGGVQLWRGGSGVAQGPSGPTRILSPTSHSLGDS